MRVRTDDGVELDVEVDGSGPGLLLVHGHGGAKEDFADHVERLAQRHTVVTFDHRGHGSSDHPTDAGSYSLARMRADTWAVADAVGSTGSGCSGTRWAGWSSGACRSSSPSASRRS